QQTIGRPNSALKDLPGDPNRIPCPAATMIAVTVSCISSAPEVRSEFSREPTITGDTVAASRSVGHGRRFQVVDDLGRDVGCAQAPALLETLAVKVASTGCDQPMVPGHRGETL